jgi:hypothetical protein
MALFDIAIFLLFALLHRQFVAASRLFILILILKVSYYGGRVD